MQLLDLPLVLVQDILQWASITIESLREVISLRLVNKLFDQEVTKYFARHRMLAAFSCRYPNWENRKFFAKVPNILIHKLFLLLVGETDRRDTVFGTTLHAVADVLFEHLISSDQRKDREQILDDICTALIIRKWDIYWSLFGYDATFSLEPKKDHPLPAMTIISIASCIAIILHYPNLPLAIPESNSTSPEEGRYILGWPLHNAIQYGDITTVDRLCHLITADDLRKRIWFIRLQAHLASAIRAGRRDVVGFVLERFQSEKSDDWKSLYCDALDVAGQSSQVSILSDILNKHLDHLTEKYLMIAFCWVSRFGLDDWVRKFHDSGLCISRRNFRSGGKYPLQCAAAGGHVKSCRILLQRWELRADHLQYDPQHYMNSIWRSAARYGSMEMVKLFETYGISKRGSELALLPIAAEYGHLEIAKWVIQHKFDKPQATKGSNRAIIERHQEFRYFSLLRAIVRGHPDIARWLVEEVRVDIDGPEGGAEVFGLTPLILAIDSGNEAMVQLILNLGASLLGQQFLETKFGLEMREARARVVNEMRRGLRLGKHHPMSYAMSQEAVEKLVILAQYGFQEDSDQKNTGTRKGG